MYLMWLIACNVVGLILRKPLSSRFKNFLQIWAKFPQGNLKKTRKKKKLHKVITPEAKTSKNYFA